MTIEREAIRAEGLDQTTPPRWQHQRLVGLELGALIRIFAAEGRGRRYAHRTAVRSG
jgi:hypothetical protein